MKPTLLPLLAACIAIASGCLSAEPAQTADPSPEQVALEAAAAQIEAEASDEAKVVAVDYHAHEHGVLPGDGIDRTFRWNVSASNYTRFEVTIRLHGLEDAPCATHTGVSYTLEGGDEGGSIRKAMNQNNAATLNTQCAGPETRILSYAPAPGAAPRGAYSLKVEIDGVGAAEWDVRIDLDY